MCDASPTRYNRLCGAAKRVVTKLSKLDPTDTFRQEQQDKLLEKLFNIGLIPTKKNMGLVDKVRPHPIVSRVFSSNGTDWPRLAVVARRLPVALHRHAVWPRGVLSTTSGAWYSG